MSGNYENPTRTNLTTQSLMLQQPQLQLHHVEMQAFWQSLSEEVRNIDPRVEDFVTHHEVSADDINAIIKELFPHFTANQDAFMALSRASEIFLLELSMRAFQQKAELTTSTIKKEDIIAAITKTEHFDFLCDMTHSDQP